MGTGACPGAGSGARQLCSPGGGDRGWVLACDGSSTTWPGNRQGLACWFSCRHGACLDHWRRGRGREAASAYLWCPWPGPEL